MIKTISIIVFLSLSITFNSYADDSDRIDQLEKEVQELKLRISKLESFLSNSNATQEAVTSIEGYRSIAKWRKLTTDMDYSEVREILGEPQRIDGGTIARWYYPNGGTVTFQSNKAWQWSEPRE
jgi:hypothetical protein